jgi:hypothetical protein
MAKIKRMEARASKAWARYEAALARMEETKVAIFAVKEQFSLLQKQQAAHVRESQNAWKQICRAAAKNVIRSKKKKR